jgi:hypothetical protein
MPKPGEFRLTKRMRLWLAQSDADIEAGAALEDAERAAADDLLALPLSLRAEVGEPHVVGYDELHDGRTGLCAVHIGSFVTIK